MFLIKINHLFLVALGLSSLLQVGATLVAVRRLLIVVASLVEHGHKLSLQGLRSCGLQALGHRLSSFDTQAQLF